MALRSLDAVHDESGLPLSDRAKQWASTMAGFEPARAGADVRTAHATPGPPVHAAGPFTREHREELEAALLAPGATRSQGAGLRLVPEEPDPFRTCFERDRDRILHA